MAKLYVKFGDKVLKEIVLSQGVVTIGRLPNNLVHLDNPGVSGSHAKVHWESGRYVVEDLGSTNGTFLNSQPVRRAELKDGDVILVGKHSLEFSDRLEEEASGAQKVVDRARHFQEQVDKSGPRKVDPTSLMDMERAKQMLATGAQKSGAVPAAAPLHAKIGVLRVVAGKADATEYPLVTKMTLIGKSAMATIRLKGWFAPKAAAMIDKRENAYIVAPSGKVAVRVNNVQISAPQELKEGDLLEVAGLKMTFSYLK